MLNWLRERLSVLFDGGHPRDPALARLFGFGRTTSGQEVTEESAQTLSAFYAAVRIYAETISQLPLPIYQRIDERSKQTLYDDPAYRVFNEEFNPEMSAIVGRETLERYAQISGNGCAEISWDGAGRIAALWPLEPWRVYPERDPDGSLFYRVDGKRRVERKDMFHLPCMGNGVWGKSIIRYAAESLGITLGAQEYGASFFGNSAVPIGVLQHPKRLGVAAAETLKKQFEAKHKGSKRGNGVFVAEEGMTYQKIGLSPEEAQFLQTRKDGVREIARWCNLPPHLLRDMDDATFSNIEQQWLEFIIMSMQPRFVRWEQEIKRKVLGPRQYAKHNINGFLRGDSAARSAFYREMFGIGAFTINNVLELEDENPIGPMGDRRFVNSAMIPIEKAGQDRQPAPPAKLAAETWPTKLLAEPLSPSGQPATSNLMATRIDLVLADAHGRMLRKEINAAQRAADKPREFFAWLDSFYPRHAELLAEALEPAVAAGLCLLNSSADAATEAHRLADLHVAKSREQFLAAADGDPAGFRERIDNVTSRWQGELFNPPTLGSLTNDQANAGHAAVA